MNNLEGNKILPNRLGLLLVNLIYYSVSLLLFIYYFDAGFSVLGLIAIWCIIIVDYLLSTYKLRVILRCVILAVLYYIVYLGIELYSSIFVVAESVHTTDLIQYGFLKNTFLPVIIGVVYLLTDSANIKKISVYKTVFSIIIFIFVGVLLFKIDGVITDTIFSNYVLLIFSMIFMILVILIKQIIIMRSFFRTRFEKKDFTILAVLLIPLVIIISLLLLKNMIDEQNKSANSGLFDRGLFMFDFSNFIELKDEIKLSDERVLIMELSGVVDSEENRINKGWDRQIYLKRFSLEQNTGSGFKSAETYSDPLTPPILVSGFVWEIPDIPEYRDRQDVEQTLYLLNISGSSLMGSDLLYRITPLKGWNDSPYKNIYRSSSRVYTGDYADLFYDTISQRGFLSEMPAGRRQTLLDLGGGKNRVRITELAQEITMNYDNIFLKSVVIQEYLRETYSYSLKPGVSPDGDQLGYFLFSSKKGYCTYFAFAMVQMLRSLDIAARVAVGFAPDMKNRTLNFYEIRALDAHAWVEVYFDEYGWVTFDPTSSNIADGEEYDFALSNKEERDDLIEGILKNKELLEEVTEKELHNRDNFFKRFVQQLKVSIRTQIIVLVILFFGVLIGFVMYRKMQYLILMVLASDNRRRVLYLYKYVKGRLFDLNITIKRDESLEEFAERVKKDKNINIGEVTTLYQRALFDTAEIQTSKYDVKKLKVRFNIELKKIRLLNRFFAFINPLRVFNRTLLLFIVLSVVSLCINTGLSADENPELHRRIKQFKDAVSESKFDLARKIIDEAEKQFPESYLPNYENGLFFYDNELYKTAVDELNKAREKGYKGYRLYNTLAASYGSIGEDRKAVETYEEALVEFPDSVDLMDNVGWMYYKVNESKKGIDIVKKGLSFSPDSSSLMMTLATLYSDDYDYESAKYYYLRAYDLSYKDYKSNSFRSILFYNLSLLEQAFLNYDNAYNYVKKSLSYAERSSGYMQLAYMHIAAIELEDAQEAVTKASGFHPSTGFPRESGIVIEILKGNLDSAEKKAYELLGDKDYSWMFYFGTSIDLFKSEIYEKIAIINEFRVQSDKFRRPENPKEALLKPLMGLWYYLKQRLYDYRASRLRLKIAAEKIDGGNSLDGLKSTYDSIKRTAPHQAIKILKRLIDTESSLMPESIRLRNIELSELEGKTLFGKIFLRNSRSVRIKEALDSCNTKWEKEYIVTGLGELYFIEQDVKLKEEISSKIYLSLPSYLPMRGIKLHAEISIDNSIGITVGQLKKINLYNSISSSIKIRFFVVENDLRIEIWTDDRVIKSSRISEYKKLSRSKLLNMIYSSIYLIEM